MNYSELLDTLVLQLDASKAKDSLANICDLLKANVKNYHWVGFYFMNNETQTLHLGPYAGKKTDHITIPFGKGICGQVADSGETFVVDNINLEDNYIACSVDVKSEIVLPIYMDGKLIAQLDIDSNTLNAFTEDDKEFLELLCSKIAKGLGNSLNLGITQ